MTISFLTNSVLSLSWSLLLPSPIVSVGDENDLLSSSPMKMAREGGGRENIAGDGEIRQKVNLIGKIVTFQTLSEIKLLDF